MDLLVDSGNSRLKWAWLRQGVLQSGNSCGGGASLTHSALDQRLGELPVPRRIWVANVAGERVEKLLRTWMESRWEVSPRFVRTQARGFGVVNGYRQPERLGVDRWLALIAVRHHYPLPACIIDCGTALTLDVLDADGCHHGGLICPGLRLMAQSLGQGTAAVQVGANTAGCTVAPLADHTAAAVTLGTRYALLGLIERSLRQLGDRWSPLHVILTGGDAAELAPQLALSVRLVPDLILKGLVVVSREP